MTPRTPPTSSPSSASGTGRRGVRRRTRGGEKELKARQGLLRLPWRSSAQSHGDALGKGPCGKTVTLMKHAPSLDSIKERLDRALPKFLVLPGVSEGIVDVPLSRVHLARLVKNILEKRNEWLATVPAFDDVQEWVAIHWDPARQTQPPAATVATSDKWGHAGEIQLDSATATCKLILAAALDRPPCLAPFVGLSSRHDPATGLPFVSGTAPPGRR